MVITFFNTNHKSNYRAHAMSKVTAITSNETKSKENSRTIFDIRYNQQPIIYDIIICIWSTSLQLAWHEIIQSIFDSYKNTALNENFLEVI